MPVTALTAEQRAALFAGGATEILQPDGVAYYANGTAYQESQAARVNTTTVGIQTTPLVTLTSDGGRLVVWGSNNQFGSNWDTYMQRYDAAGAAAGGQTLVNTTTTGHQSPFALLTLSDGGQMIVWTNDQGASQTFTGQRLDVSGAKVGGEVALANTDFNYKASFAALAGGGFVMVEAHQGANIPAVDLYAQLYNSAGTKLGGEIQLTPNGANLSGGSFDVETRAGGGFLTAYFQPGDWTDHIQAYDGTGVATGQPLVISNGGSPVRLTELAGGRFLVSWGANDWHGQIYDNAGAAVGAPLQLTGTSLLNAPQATAMSDGGFELTWTFSGNGGSAIGGQRFDVNGLHVGDIETLVAHGSTPFVMALPDGSFTLAYDDPSSPTNIDDVYQKTYAKLDYHVLTAGSDTVAGAATDTLVVTKASDLGAGDSLIGGAGNDTLELSASGVANLAALASFSGFETLLGAGGNDTFVLSATGLASLSIIDGRGGGNHVQLTGAGVVQPNGKGLFDLSHVTVTNADVIGTAGGDIVTLGSTGLSVNGGQGDDVLVGGSGHDVLTGGAGPDTLTGGGGDDVFIDSLANFNGDTITDFSIGDVLQINNLGLTLNTSFSLAGSSLTYAGSVLTLPNLPVGYHLKLTPLPSNAVWFQLVQSLPNNGHSGDFNGDGKDDLFWRTDAGQMSNWLGQASGGFVGNEANSQFNAPSGWRVIGAGDFNGDGKDDILWRSDIGQMSNWLGQANGGFVNNDTNAFTSVPTSWQVAGVGDFNGDGKSDLLWRSDSGQMSDWLGQASGGFVGNDANAFAHVSVDWHIIGVGDFNGDNRDDILWRSESGLMSNWLGQANGGFAGNDGNALMNVPDNWHVVGVGDFNGDGRDDILWRSDTGLMSDWLAKANGGFSNNDTNAFTSVPTDWVIVGVGDYNGDSRDDILWRNSITGALSDWLGQANGGFIGNDANAYATVSTAWHIQVDNVFAV